LGGSGLKINMLNRTVAQFEANEKQKQDNAASRLEERRILSELGPLIWKRFRVALNAECQKYPKHFTFEVQPDTDAIVRGPKGKKLLVQYLSAANVISYESKGASGTLPIRLDDEDEAMIRDGNVLKSPEESAEELLEMLLA
jgi:hypothetical protein